MNRRPLTLSTGFALCLLLRIASAASVDGADLHFTASGDGSQTVMLVHGWTCDSTSWDAQVPALNPDYRVITLDLPGHGLSGMPANGEISMDLFARAVEAVRIEAGVDSLVLVGHSMGTPVIRRYALTYPKRVDALVLVDGLVQIPGSPATPIPSVTGESGRVVREALVRSMFDERTPAPVQQRILDMMLGTSEIAADASMRATWDRSDWTADPISVPALGIYAEDSTMGNLEGLTLLYPAIEYHEVPGTNHFLMMEKPDEFNRLLRSFLAEIE